MCSEKTRSVYQQKLSDATIMGMEGEEEEGPKKSSGLYDGAIQIEKGYVDSEGMNVWR